MRICPECGKGIDEHFTECPNCGYPFNGKEKHVRGKACPDCGREIPIEEKECPYCGYDFEQAEQLARIKQQAEEAEEKARLAAYKAKAAEERLRRQKQKQKQQETQRKLEEYQRKIQEAEAKEKAAKERIQKASAEEKNSFNKDLKDKEKKSGGFDSFGEKPETSSQKVKKSKRAHKQHDKKPSKKKIFLRNIGIVIACILVFFVVVIAWNRTHPHLIYVIDNEGLLYSIPWNSTEYEVEQKIDDVSENGTWKNSTNSHKYVVSSPYFLAISGLNGKISLILHKNDKNEMVLDNATIEFSAGKDCKASKSDVYQKLKDQYDERFGKSDDGINWDTEKSKIKIAGVKNKSSEIKDLKVKISEKGKADTDDHTESPTSSETITPTPTEEPESEEPVATPSPTKTPDSTSIPEPTETPTPAPQPGGIKIESDHFDATPDQMVDYLEEQIPLIKLEKMDKNLAKDGVSIPAYAIIDSNGSSSSVLGIAKNSDGYVDGFIIFAKDNDTGLSDIVSIAYHLDPSIDNIDNLLGRLYSGERQHSDFLTVSYSAPDGGPYIGAILPKGTGDDIFDGVTGNSN